MAGEGSSRAVCASPAAGGPRLPLPLHEHQGQGVHPQHLCQVVEVMGEEPWWCTTAATFQDKAHLCGGVNSVEAWGQHYNLSRHFHAKDCQAAVSAMDTWRASLLQKAAHSPHASVTGERACWCVPSLVCQPRLVQLDDMCCLVQVPPHTMA